MAYSPLNASVYLRALIGFMSGISGNDVTDTNQAQVGSYATMADAYAQEVDQTFGSGTPTSTELGIIEESSESMWRGKSVLEASSAFKPGSYLQIAQSVVAKALQANAQVVSEGVDPNATSGGTGSSSPLTHGRWIDGSTATPAATQNGAIGTPYGTIQTWLTKLPASANAADSQAIQLGFLTPNAAGSYTENLVVPAYRSIELHGMPGLTILLGNVTCTNTHTAAGTTPAPASLFHVFKNLLIEGVYTITDDGTVASIGVFEADASIESAIDILVATGALAFADCFIMNEVCGSLTSTANATGAACGFFLAASVGNVIAQSIQSDYAVLSGTSYTVFSSSTNSLIYTLFTASNPVLTGGTWNMDQTSYNSFISAGGTLAGGATIVVSPYTSFLLAPQNMAAGASVVGAAGAGNNFLVDLTGAQPQYTTNPTPVLGEQFRFKSKGTGNTPLKLVASAGQQLEIPGAQGTFTGVAGNTSFAAGNGGAITYQYDGVAKWYIVATA